MSFKYDTETGKQIFTSEMGSITFDTKHNDVRFYTRRGDLDVAHGVLCIGLETRGNDVVVKKEAEHAVSIAPKILAPRRIIKCTRKPTDEWLSCWIEKE